MILLRRLVAILLIPVFVLSLFAVVLLLRINETALEPTFWVEELRKADVYDFAYDSILPAAVDEAIAAVENDTVDVSQFADEIGAAVEDIVPPEWVQEQVETALLSVLPYFLGETDTFTLTLSPGDRLESAAEVLKRELKNEEVFGRLYAEAVDWAATQATQNIGALPVDLPMTKVEAEEYIRRVLPPEWLQSNLETFVDAALPYAGGETDQFAVKIELGERVEEVSAVLKEILGKANTYDLLVNTVIAPVIEANLRSGVEVTSGVGFSSTEILDVVREVLDPEWASGVETRLIDALADFLTGKIDEPSVVISLAGRQAAATSTLTSWAELEIQRRFDDLNECALEDVVGIDLSAGVIPACRPPGIAYEEFRERSGIDSSMVIGRFLGTAVPDSYTLGGAEIRRIIGESGWAMLERVRGWTSDGFVLTERDVTDRLEPSQVATFDDFRADFNDGFTLTEADFRDVVGEDAAAAIDSGRRGIALARSAAPLAWVSIGLFLVVIGGLAGRNWGSRLAWAGFTLTFGAGLLWAATGPIYSSLSQTAFDLLHESLSADSTSRVGTLAIELGLRVGRTIADDFVGGLASQALILLVIGVAATVGGFILQALVRPRATPAPIQAK